MFDVIFFNQLVCNINKIFLGESGFEQVYIQI